MGLWRLVSFREQRGTQFVDYLGPDAKGYISYHPTGHMSALLARPDRPRFRGAWADIAAPDKAAALDGMVSYAGRFSDFGDRLVHHVEICWIPNWEGRDLVRLAAFDGPDRMTLRTIPDESGKSPLQVVEWERVVRP